MRYTELFYSLQGEGRYVGVPSVFLRMFGCNLRCPHFGARGREGLNPEVEEVIKNIDQYKTFEDLPLVRTGCDSYAAVYPVFKKFAKDKTPEELAVAIDALVPHDKPYHLVITGGEPLLIGWQKQYMLMFDALPERVQDVTFETNGTQLLAPAFSEFLKRCGRRITFSVSPKLSSSGEDMGETINPDVIASYQALGETYVKFVVTSEHDLDDIERAVSQFKEAGFIGSVYCMPAGGCIEEYAARRQEIASLCMGKGWFYSPRLHVDIWGNSWGT